MASAGEPSEPGSVVQFRSTLLPPSPTSDPPSSSLVLPESSVELSIPYPRAYVWFSFLLELFGLVLLAGVCLLIDCFFSLETAFSRFLDVLGIGFLVIVLLLSCAVNIFYIASTRRYAVAIGMENGLPSTLRVVGRSLFLRAERVTRVDLRDGTRRTFRVEKLYAKRGIDWAFPNGLAMYEFVGSSWSSSGNGDSKPTRNVLCQGSAKDLDRILRAIHRQS